MNPFNPFKVCMACKCLTYDDGDRAYSDTTPAIPPTFTCQKGHWYEMLDPDFTEKELHKFMNKARTCVDFELRG